MDQSRRLVAAEVKGQLYASTKEIFALEEKTQAGAVMRRMEAQAEALEAETCAAAKSAEAFQAQADIKEKQLIKVRQENQERDNELEFLIKQIEGNSDYDIINS